LATPGWQGTPMELDLRIQRHEARAVIDVGGEVGLATCP
jgi:hypothetical protein